jgi:long-subunit fatty acid transport protein
VLIALFAMAAQAAGLDLLEVGGAWGTPGATNPTAIWWNPAGLAVGGGTQFIVEGAPVLANVYAERANPNYGDVNVNPFTGLDAPLGGEYPDSYNYAGRADIKVRQVVPFIGASSDFGVDGLGIGLGMAVPTGRGGAVENPDGVFRYHLRDGDIRAIQAILAASYQVKDVVSFGVSGNFVDSTWGSTVDTSVYTDLASATAAFLGQDVPPNSFRDGYIENPAYSTTSNFKALRDQAFTFGAGVYITPTDNLGISVAFNKGVRLDHQGDLALSFACPPEYDFLANAGAVSRGLCNTTMNGQGEVGYSLPSRMNFGLVYNPTPKVRLEAMGSWVGWKVFTDYEIQTIIGADQIEPVVVPLVSTEEDLPALRAEAQGLLNAPRLWARDHRNTYWMGLDAKGDINEYLMIGGRVFYDRAAVPTQAVLVNNFDTNTLGLSGMAMVSPVKQFGIALSWSHHVMFTRTVDNSLFAMTINPANARDPRYQYPSGNGTYGGSINRIGISLRGRFGGAEAPKW